MEIRKLMPGDREAVHRAMDAVAASGEKLDFIFRYGRDLPFADYVAKLEGWEKGENLPERFVPQSFYVGIVDGEIVSRVSVRYKLNEFLREYGGHIGYHTAPGHEGKGYAKRLFHHALRLLNDRGLDEAFVTCEPTNAPSRHIIESSGGKFRDEAFVEWGQNLTLRRYWVPTAPFRPA